MMQRPKSQRLSLPRSSAIPINRSRTSSPPLLPSPSSPSQLESVQEYSVDFTPDALPLNKEIPHHTTFSPEGADGILQFSSTQSFAQSTARNPLLEPLNRTTATSHAKKLSRKQFLMFLLLPALILLAGIGIGVYVLVMFVQCSDADKDVTRWVQFAPSELSSVHISTRAARVEVLDSPIANVVELQFTSVSYSTANIRKHEPTFYLRDRELVVTSESGTDFVSCMDVEIRLMVCPQKTDLDIVIFTDSGDITIVGDDLLTAKSILIGTGSGNAYIERVIVPSINVTSGSGDLNTYLLNGTSLSAVSTRGHLHLNAKGGYEGQFSLESPQHKPIVAGRGRVHILSETESRTSGYIDRNVHEHSIHCYSESGRCSLSAEKL